MKCRSVIFILFLILIMIPAISAENETVKNTHNTDINDEKYINPNDYYFDDNGTRTKYTSDTGSFNNVTMSNGYNAYAIQDGGYIETKDPKSHPSFWNDTYQTVDANDTKTVVGHWHYADKKPIGEYLKILFYKNYDNLIRISPNPNIPSSIYVQSMVWDLYKNADDIDKLEYAYTKDAVISYNNGYRVNNSDNVQWINKTAYRIFDFLGFKNQNSMHKDLWGFKVRYFNASGSGNSSTNNETNMTNDTEMEKEPDNNTQKNKTVNNASEMNKKENNKTTQKRITENKNKSSIKKTNPNSSIKSLELKTANPTILLVVAILLIILIVLVKRHI